MPKDHIHNQRHERRIALLDSLPHLIFFQDERTVYVDYHAGIPEALFVPPEEFLGKTTAEVLPPDLAAEFDDLLRKAHETGRSQLLDYTLTINGAVKHFQATISPYGEHQTVSIIRDITGQKLAEQVLQETNETLKAVLSATPVGIALIQNGALKWTNETLAAMLGRDQQDLTGENMLPFFEDIHEFDRVRKALYHQLENSGRGHVDTRLLCAHDSFIQCHIQLRHVDPTSRDKGEIIVVVDISERKKAEEALANSERLYRHAIEAAAGVPYRLDYSQNTFTFVGDGIEELLDVSPEEFSHGVIAEMIRECVCKGTNKDTLLREYDRAFRAGEVDRFHADYRVLTPSGQEKWISDFAAPVKDENTGEVIASLGIMQDITERKRAEEALREGERRFREMADLLPDMIYETGPDLRITYINQRITELLGYSEEDILGNFLTTDMLTEDEAVRGRERLEHIAATGKPSVGIFNVKTKNGALIPCEIHTAPMRSPDGALAGFRGVLRDITARRKAEQGERIAAVGQLAAGVAHEFNNILAIISGRAQLAQAFGTDEALAKFVDTALSATSRGADISKRLLDYARPSDPERSPVLIERPIDAALSLAAQEIQNAQIILKRNYHTEGKPVLADAGQLQEVFLNLIINACHAMPDGGELAIEAGHIPAIGDGPGEIIVTLSDTGTGIPPGDLPHIFEPFFTTKGRLGESEIAGTGLGLSVAHGVITAHEGTITVQSEPDVGTTFEIRLAASSTSPTTVAAGIAAKPQDIDLQARPDAGRSILLAEDEDDLRQTVAELLTDRGFHTVTANTTDQALHALQTTSFDVVITDLLMPGGGGEALLAATRELPTPPAVIVITGKTDKGLPDKLIAAGARACFRKPFSFADLLETIADVIGERPPGLSP